MRQKKLSNFRALYQVRLVFRILTLAASVFVLFNIPEQFDVMLGFNFFKSFSFFHFMWFVWMFEMVSQLVPGRGLFPIGSQKFLKYAFKPRGESTNLRGMEEFLKSSRRGAALSGAFWLCIVAALACVYFAGIVDRRLMLLFVVFFYVSDVICVLYWCPFRVLFLKTRCCATCRIFNWDHLMMFAPLFFIPGFYTWSLCFVALLIFAVWERAFFRHPERFWEGSNEALSCRRCTDKLCPGRR